MRIQWKQILAIMVCMVFFTINLSAQEKEEKRFNVIFRQGPLSMVTNYLSLQSGISVNNTAQVKGRIDVNLNDVSITEALQNISQNYGWEFVLENGSYTIMTQKEYAEYQKKLMVDHTFEVKHIMASEAMSLLKTRITQGGTINADDRTGKLFVKDLKPAIESIGKIIAEIDVPVVTRVFNLEQALPADVEKLVKNFLSKRGKISTDDRLRQVIITDLQENVRKIEDVIEEVDTLIDIRVYRIKYLVQTKERKELEDLKKAIEAILTPKKSFIQLDERTNTIIVKDIPSVLDQVDKIIEAYDQPPKMCYLVARLYQLKVKDTFTLGVDYAGSLKNGIQDLTYNASFADGTGTLSIFDGDKFSAIISAIDDLSNSKVLIAPQMLIKNRQTGKLNHGGDKPYTVKYSYGSSSSDDGTSYSQRTVDYGKIFECTPTIGNDNLIDIELKIENSDATQLPDTASDIVLIEKTKSELETTLTIPSGKGIMMGGITDSQSTHGKTGLPFLNRIPILGSLFSKKDDNMNDTELYFFLYARIIDYEKDFFNSEVKMPSFDETTSRVENAVNPKYNEFLKGCFK